MKLPAGLLSLFSAVFGQQNFTESLTGLQCCKALSAAGLNESIFLPGTGAYQDRVDSYFSIAARLKPSCILAPSDVTEVSKGVKTLAQHECSFAIRSGGHMHIPGSNNIEDGVTVDFARMANTKYHAENSTASVQPGAVWGDVYKTLDKEGVMVAGGRSSTVGVGGLVLGGGNSYYAGKKGMVCDNVAQFEVVLSSGEIVTASSTEHADLFQVLKGGGNNFGIVTRYDLMTFEGGNLWGGIVTYPEAVGDQMFPAFVDFAKATEQDEAASAILIDSYLSAQGAPFFMNAYDYSSPVSRHAAFNSFFNIGSNMSDTTRLANMTSLALEFEQPATFRVSFSTLTFENDLKVLQKAHELFLRMTETLGERATGEWRAFALYQPIPTLFAKHSKEKGGNVLGLDRFNKTLVLYEPFLAWTGDEQDDLFNGQAAWIKAELRKYAQSIGAANEFLYLDYADVDQNPLDSYGEANVVKMKAAAKKYDPKQVMQRLVPGGFKISRVGNGEAELPDTIERDEL